MKKSSKVIIVAMIGYLVLEEPELCTELLGIMSTALDAVDKAAKVVKDE